MKSGRVPEFLDTWRMLVAAHTKAGIDEHWAVYEVESGMPDTTFLFVYPRKSLAEIDAAGPSHAAAGFREAVGDGGRRQMTGVEQDCHRDERDASLPASSRYERPVEGMGGDRRILGAPGANGGLSRDHEEKVGLKSIRGQIVKRAFYRGLASTLSREADACPSEGTHFCFSEPRHGESTINSISHGAGRRLTLASPAQPSASTSNRSMAAPRRSAPSVKVRRTNNPRVKSMM